MMTGILMAMVAKMYNYKQLLLQFFINDGCDILVAIYELHNIFYQFVQVFKRRFQII